MKIGEYDVLPRVQTDQIYDANMIGEIYAEIFEDDELVDMAISNRKGYEETDERYKTLLEVLRPLIKYVAESKSRVNADKKNDLEQRKRSEEFQTIKKSFLESGSKTGTILKEKLDHKELETVVSENYQFVRAVELTKKTKKILISHNSKYKAYGDFLLSIFEKIGIDIESTIIYTSDPRTTLKTDDDDVLKYLKDCFREDIYVIFILSKYFYDSNYCLAETGAAWATNKKQSNLLVDVKYDDLEHPFVSSEQNLTIGNLNEINHQDFTNFILNILDATGMNSYSFAEVEKAILLSIQEFSGKIDKLVKYYPRRKYQAHPTCENKDCSNYMVLDIDNSGDVIFRCSDKNCSHVKRAIID